MRLFKEQWVSGTWYSKEQQDQLADLLKEGLTEIGIMQYRKNPGAPRIDSVEDVKRDKALNRKSMRRIDDIAADIYCALTGKNPK